MNSNPDFPVMVACAVAAVFLFFFLVMGY